MPNSDIQIRNVRTSTELIEYKFAHPRRRRRTTDLSAESDVALAISRHLQPYLSAATTSRRNRIPVTVKVASNYKPLETI